MSAVRPVLLFVAAVIAVGLALGPGSARSAAAVTTPAAGVVTPAPVGTAISFVGRLTVGGVALAGRTLRYQLDGVTLFSIQTDTAGVVTVKVRRNLTPGTHVVALTYDGDPTRGYEASSAQGSLTILPPFGTTLVLSLPLGQRTGEAMAVDVSVYRDGRPVAGARLHITVAGHHVALRSDAAGHIHYRLSRKLPPGTYAVTVRYHGDRSRGLLGASTSGSLTVLPALVTSVKLQVPGKIAAGQEAAVVGQLASDSGPLPARTPVELLLDGAKRATLETDAAGRVHLKLPRHLAAGDHVVMLVYHGNKRLGIEGASATASLSVLPILLRLQAVPALSGVTFLIDGEPHLTGSDGLVSTPLAVAGAHTVSVRAPADRPDAQTHFVRWYDEQTHPDRTFRIFGDEIIHAFFAGSYLTPVTFRDADGRPLDPARLSMIQISGPSHELIDLPPGRDRIWLDTPAPSRAALLGVANQARYTIEAAHFDGVSVATRGDDSYVPGPGRSWNVKLRVFTLRIQVRQPVVGSGIRSLVLSSADGRKLPLHPDANGFVELHDLPRGLYSVAPAHRALVPTVLVQLTRNQVVQMSFFTSEEATAGTVLMLLASMALAAAAITIRRRS